MSSLRRHEGYLLIDHRNAPGSAPHPDPSRSVPAGVTWESATVTCSHCGAVVVLNPDRSRPRHYCQSCDHYVCDKPACVLVCDPMAKKIARLYEQALKLIGSAPVADEGEGVSHG